MNRDIHKVNIVFDILHIIGNSPITLLKIGKILGMVHDPSVQRRDIRLFKISSCSMGSGGGRDKLH